MQQSYFLWTGLLLFILGAIGIGCNQSYAKYLFYLGLAVSVLFGCTPNALAEQLFSQAASTIHNAIMEWISGLIALCKFLISAMPYLDTCICKTPKGVLMIGTLWVLTQGTLYICTLHSAFVMHPFILRAVCQVIFQVSAYVAPAIGWTQWRIIVMLTKLYESFSHFTYLCWLGLVFIKGATVFSLLAASLVEPTVAGYLPFNPTQNLQQKAYLDFIGQNSVNELDSEPNFKQNRKFGMAFFLLLYAILIFANLQSLYRHINL